MSGYVDKAANLGRQSLPITAVLCSIFITVVGLSAILLIVLGDTTGGFEILLSALPTAVAIIWGVWLALVVGLAPFHEDAEPGGVRE